MKRAIPLDLGASDVRKLENAADYEHGKNRSTMDDAVTFDYVIDHRFANCMYFLIDNTRLNIHKTIVNLWTILPVNIYISPMKDYLYSSCIRYFVARISQMYYFDEETMKKIFDSGKNTIINVEDDKIQIMFQNINMESLAEVLFLIFYF